MVLPALDAPSAVTIFSSLGRAKIAALLQLVRRGEWSKPATWPITFRRDCRPVWALSAPKRLRHHRKPDPVVETMVVRIFLSVVGQQCPGRSRCPVLASVQHYSQPETVLVGVRSGPPGTSQQKLCDKNEHPAERLVPRGFSFIPVDLAYPTNVISGRFLRLTGRFSRNLVTSRF